MTCLTCRSLSILIVTLPLAACNLPQLRSLPEPPPMPIEAAEEAELPEAVPTPSPGAVDSAFGPASLLSPSPTPAVPEGWMEYVSSGLGLRLHHPPDWQVIADTTDRLDLRHDVDNGWIEINLIDETRDDEWGLSYTPGAEAADLLNRLLPALREDGNFNDPRPIHTRSGQMAWATTGDYTVLEDKLLVAFVSFPERALLILGHDGQDSAAWEAELIPIYETIIQSIQ